MELIEHDRQNSDGNNNQPENRFVLEHTKSGNPIKLALFLCRAGSVKQYACIDIRESYGPGDVFIRTNLSDQPDDWIRREMTPLVYEIVISALEKDGSLDPVYKKIARDKVRRTIDSAIWELSRLEC